MLKVYVALGSVFIFMLWRCCTYGLVSLITVLRKDQILAWITCFCCHKHSWKMSWRLLKTSSAFMPTNVEMPSQTVVSCATNTGGKCPDISLKISSGFSLINVEAGSQAEVSHLAAFATGCRHKHSWKISWRLFKTSSAIMLTNVELPSPAVVSFLAALSSGCCQKHSWSFKRIWFCPWKQRWKMSWHVLKNIQWFHLYKC